MKRASEFWFPPDPDALQIVGGVVVGIFLIVTLIELTRTLWRLICR